MKAKFFNTSVIVVSILTCLFACQKKEKIKKTQPNIVLILVDDLGIAQLGAYGSKYYKTPNIDRLAKNGMKFTNAYTAAAICSPTRASILTGKYPARLKITDFIPGAKNTHNLLKQPNWQKYLPLKELTFAEVLKEKGYNTAWLGKWHLSEKKFPPESLKLNPDKQGFDDTFVTYKPSKSLPIKKWQKAELDAHNVDTLTNRAIRFIEKAPKNKPFFLSISHNSIHDPLMEKEEVIKKFEENSETIKDENHPVIAAMMETLDKSIGKIIKKINTLNLDKNTVVVFYSDNGAKHSHASQIPFRKGKGWLYEGGIHVPLIVKWPTKIKSNSVSDAMISSIDLFPTFLELANVNTSKKIDGISFTSILFDSSKKIDRKTLYWHYPHYHNGSGMKPASAIRSGKYKLIEWHEAKLLKKENIYELYNLETDIGETKNLVNTLPGKVNELKILLHKWKKEVKAQEPTINN